MMEITFEENEGSTLGERMEQLIRFVKEDEKWYRPSIYRLPMWWPDIQQKAAYYKPQAVSFGPYHHGQPHLQAMEKRKQRALVQFVARARKPVDSFLTALGRVKQELMGHYEDLDDKWRGEDEKFVELMMVDGCFMLEILYYYADLNIASSKYAANDPIFSPHGRLYNMPHIKRDMLMLENQIPLLVLERLVNVERGDGEHKRFIHELIVRFCASSMMGSGKGLGHDDMGLGLHVLDVARKSLVTRSSHPESRLIRRINKVGAAPKVPSATQLEEAGIRFESRKTPSLALTDIKFSNGILSIPTIVVDDATELTLLNLMAFERLHVGAANEATAYVYFMDNLINSDRDVAFLQSRGIIRSSFGTYQQVADLFNRLSTDAALDADSDLGIVYEEMGKYCRRKCSLLRANRHLVDLRHAYFKSPVTFISLVAATLLLLLTVIQTVYAVLSYHYHE